MQQKAFSKMFPPSLPLSSKTEQKVCIPGGMQRPNALHHLIIYTGKRISRHRQQYRQQGH
jgi:hypothetical protein